MSEQPINNNWKWFRFITDKWDEYQAEEVEISPINGKECDWEKDHTWIGSEMSKPSFWIHYDDENGGIEENYQYCPNCGRKLRKD